MIIRRFVTALRKQDWTTVAIEFLIVVVGIFVGLQVDEWRTDIKLRAEEQVILEQILLNSNEALGLLRESAVSDGDRLRNLLRARSLVLAEFTQEEMPAEICRELFNSNRMAEIGTLKVAVLEELQASGRISLIFDPAIRKQVQQVLIASDANLEEAQFRAAMLQDLPMLFPDLIRAELTANDDPDDIDGYSPVYLCDLQGMRQSVIFSNALQRNASAHGGLNNWLYNFYMPTLERLVTLLEAEVPSAAISP